jgi:hypothetical protein
MSLYLRSEILAVMRRCSILSLTRDLRTPYTLGSVPQRKEPDGLFRKIRVKVSAPDRSKIHVRTRSGYFLPGKTQAGAQSW